MLLLWNGETNSKNSAIYCAHPSTMNTNVHELNFSNDNLFFGIFYFQSSIPWRGASSQVSYAYAQSICLPTMLVVNIKPFNILIVYRSSIPILIPRQTIQNLSNKRILCCRSRSANKKKTYSLMRWIWKAATIYGSLTITWAEWGGVNETFIVIVNRYLIRNDMVVKSLQSWQKE